MSQHRLNTLMLIALSGLLLLATPVRARDIFIAGDSTASVYGPEVFPRMGWGQVLGDFYAEDINVVDLAQSGRSSKSFIDEGFFAVLEKQIGAGDILLIQFGHNDEKEYDPTRYTEAGTSFKTYLKKYIDLALEKDATPVLLTPVVRRKFENGALVPTHGEYPDAMRELAADTGTALIDMTRLSGQFVAGLGEENSKAVYLHSAEPDGPKEDNTHFSETGAYAMASLVARGLDALHLVTYQAVPGTFIRVEKDGSGDATRIQDAIDGLSGSAEPAFILIGEGVFDEKLFITRDHIALAGKGADRTTIRATQLRAHWRETHEDDWGAATINLKASDVTFMKLRVLNDYGILHGDNGHQFAMRLMAGSRIITEDSVFISGGADTVSLWNKQDGMYFHRRDYFEGYTDFVCPRGWSFITDSAFFSRGGAAAIWHDGAQDQDQKLVIRNSSFDGVENFILGRRHYDAQFYLVDNRYSANMADLPILRFTHADPGQDRPNRWGDRAYYSGARKQGEPYAWLADNLPGGLPDITPAWTFADRWDPESRLKRLKVQIALHETGRPFISGE